MLHERVGISLAQCIGEIAAELAAQIWIVRHGRIEQLGVKRKLGIGQQHGQFRPGERVTASRAFGDLHVVGQELDRTVELAARLQRLHQPLMKSEIL